VSAPLRRLDAPRPADVPPRVEYFLRALGGPAAIHIPGRDRSRTRAATTLLHGNEPSGVRALHAWLRAGHTPAVDALLVIANVPAALAPPGFAHRTLPGRRDLNRCFLGPFDDAEGRLAEAILTALREARPEALVDVHNNTGHNPSYGVGLAASPAVLHLTALFGERLVVSDLRIGALIEAVRELASVTVEVGRSGDPAADACALEGLGAFFARDPVVPATPPPALQLLRAPLRATLRPGVRVAVADAPAAQAELTMLADLDRHNFEPVAAGVPIGWVQGGRWPLEVRDGAGRDLSRELFRIEGARLVTRRSFVPIMITTDPGIAASDCLFYVVSPPLALPDGTIHPHDPEGT
jgi:hypothetical protein